MTRIVVPFRGSGAKLRLAPLGERERHELALAMLGDVLAAATVLGDVTVVTDDADASALAQDVGAHALDDPGEGQGAAVATALQGAEPGAILVVNADLPCAVPHDLRALQRATPAGGLAYVPAADGTTNALGLPGAELFAPLYGPGSGARFRDHAAALGIDVEALALGNLVDDVDTLSDLVRFGTRAGARTAELVEAIAL